MKTLFIAILFFIVGFVIGGGLGIKFSLDFGFDQLLKNIQNSTSSMLLSGTNVVSSKLKAIYEEKKEEIISNLEKQKEQIISNVKQSIKEKLEEEINSLFK